MSQEKFNDLSHSTGTVLSFSNQNVFLKLYVGTIIKLGRYPSTYMLCEVHFAPRPLNEGEVIYLQSAFLRGGI